MTDITSDQTTTMVTVTPPDGAETTFTLNVKQAMSHGTEMTFIMCAGEFMWAVRPIEGVRLIHLKHVIRKQKGFPVGWQRLFLLSSTTDESDQPMCDEDKLVNGSCLALIIEELDQWDATSPLVTVRMRVFHWRYPFLNCTVHLCGLPLFFPRMSIAHSISRKIIAWPRGVAPR